MIRYRLSSHVALEHFSEGSLALIIHQRRIVELSCFEAAMIKLLEKDLSLEAISAELSKNPKYHTLVGTENMLKSLEKLKEERILMLESNFDPQKAGNMSANTIKYLRDPDVVIREEDPEEGALLFHPDTNQVKVLNATGFYIWQQCDQAATLEEITKKVVDAFEDAPHDDVAKDVNEFIDSMVATGFIGSVTAYEPQG